MQYEKQPHRGAGAGSRLLTVDEVAERFYVSRTSVYRLIDGQRLPVYRIGGVLRFAADDVAAFLESSKSKPVTP